MAIYVTKSSIDLGSQFILTPERYNPKRRMAFITNDGILLSELVTLSNETVSIKRVNDKECYQINTSDAMEGCLRISKHKEILKNNKKKLHKGEVIISRLRPYLRQVAYVDVDTDQELFCASAEFYVLRSRSEESIAYLVPFLLSDAVQEVFANAVEGSQHPRFKEDDLLNLIVSRRVFDKRYEMSEKILNAIKYFRLYENGIIGEIERTNSAINF